MRAACLALPALVLLALVPAATSSTDATGAGPCPERLEARENGDGSVTLEWAPVEGAREYRIHRATGDRPFEEGFARVDAPVTSFRDGATETGATYHYVVTAGDAALSGTACLGVSAKSIPYARGLATALGVTAVCVLGYALLAGTRRAPVPRR